MVSVLLFCQHKDIKSNFSVPGSFLAFFIFMCYLTLSFPLSVSFPNFGKLRCQVYSFIFCMKPVYKLNPSLDFTFTALVNVIECHSLASNQYINSQGK